MYIKDEYKEELISALNYEFYTLGFASLRKHIGTTTLFHSRFFFPQVKFIIVLASILVRTIITIDRILFPMRLISFAFLLWN